MPTYEYKNIETGELYEFKQSMRDDALTVHPETGAAIKRIVSRPAISFKGSGFYANDSRDSRSGGRAGGAAKTEGAGSTEHGAGGASQGSEGGSGAATSSTAGASSAQSTGAAAPAPTASAVNSTVKSSPKSGE